MTRSRDTNPMVPLMEHDEQGSEIRSLRRCLSDLLALMAVPAAWATRDPEDIAITTLDMLVAALRLEFACIRLDDSVGGAPFLIARLAQGRESALDAATICESLTPWLRCDPGEEQGTCTLPGVGEVAIARRRLGLQDDLGILVVGADRPDFPNALERLLLGVACNQAAMGLHEARRVREQRRGAMLRAERRELEARFDAILGERTRIAREMHDTLLQGFTGVSLHLVTLARGTVHPAATRDALDQVIALTQRTLTEGRQAVSGLRAPAAGRADVLESLRDLVEDTLGHWDIRVHQDVDGVPRPLAPAVELTVMRVMREALTNVVKHARARAVRIHVTFEARDIEVAIRDDGRGFVVDGARRTDGEHWGVIGMRERALESHGVLRIQSAPGRGTEVSLRVPYGAPVSEPRAAHATDAHPGVGRDAPP